MVHEVELSSIPTLDISVGVTVNGQNLHLLVFKDEEFRLNTQNSNKNIENQIPNCIIFIRF